MTFSYPLALLLPLLYLVTQRREPPESAPYPAHKLLASRPTSWRITLRRPILLTLETIAVIGLTLAIAQPVQVDTLHSGHEARNVMLALDVSGSMRAKDFLAGRTLTSRFEAVVSVVQDFIAERPSDRLGLVVFGSHAFVQAPLTRDHTVVDRLVGDMRPGMAGEGTAIGEGLGVALKRLQAAPDGSRAVILLTDGVNNSGTVSPTSAATVARDLKVKVHTIGIGRNERGAEYDEALLREIATVTGGHFFNAEDRDQLAAVYEEIQRLEMASDEDPVTIRHELFFIPLCIAAAALTAAILFASGPLMRVP